jgi:hypothetical protein
MNCFFCSDNYDNSLLCLSFTVRNLAQQEDFAISSIEYNSDALLS